MNIYESFIISILFGIVHTPMAIIVNSIIVKLNPQIHSLNK